MGKKKVITKDSKVSENASSSKKTSKTSKKKFLSGILCIEATFNNTRVTLTDKSGNVLASTSAGSLGFKGAKKGTPFAAGKAGSIIGEKAKEMGMKEVDVMVKGVGSGREPTIRSFMANEIDIINIKDMTPVPHNGPKPKKPRRV